GPGAGLLEDLKDIAQRLLGLGNEVIALELLARVPADLTGEEDQTTLRGDAVAVAPRGGPVSGVERQHGVCLPCALSLKRWIFPVSVFGSAAMNLTERGYL